MQVKAWKMQYYALARQRGGRERRATFYMVDQLHKKV